MGNRQDRPLSPTSYSASQPASFRTPSHATSRPILPQSSVTKPVVDMNRLSFNTNCGSRVRLDNHNRTAERLKFKDEYNNGVVITDRVLKPDEMFQLRMDKLVHNWSGGIQLGITTADPNFFTIPSTMSDAISVGQNTTIMWDGTCVASDQNRERDYGIANLENLQEGDTVGLKRTSSGDLHFYVNGKDQGVAESGVPAKVRGVLDLYGNAVKATIVDSQSVIFSVQKNTGSAVDNTKLLFHPICASNAQIVSQNRTAVRGTDDFSNALVMSNRKLYPGERFEVVIEKSITKWAGGLEIGVTQHTPDKILFPSTLTELTSKCWALTGGSVFKDGHSSVRDYGANLDTLVDGDTVGVTVMKNGDLHFYVNGQDQGKALSSIPLDVYAIVDMYGQTAQISVLDRTQAYAPAGGSQAAAAVPSASYDTSSMELRFHQRCGQHASVINDRNTAIREATQFNYGVVFSHRELEPEEMFEIEIEEQMGTWSGSIEMGVTTYDPNDPTFDMPSTMSFLEGGTWMMTGSGVMHSGVTANNHYGSNLDDLVIGDRVGCRVKSNGALHFYINGKDLGAACTKVPFDVFGVIDVYGLTTQVGIVNSLEVSPGLAPSAYLRASATVSTFEGISITFKKGSINQEQVEVIVNTTAKDLVLSAGASSRAILQAAGSGIQDECKKKAPNGVKHGELVETTGGKMKGVRAIYHGSIAGWDGGKGEKILQDFLKNVLRKAHQSGRKSLALPAIGTGILQFPPETVSRLMIEEITAFSKQYPKTPLQDIRIVLFDRDEKTIKGFESYLMSNSDVQREEKKPNKPMPKQIGVALPDTWTEMRTDQPLLMVTLLDSSPEYKEVYDRFIDKGGPKNIKKIERIQSSNMYMLYAIHRHNLEQYLQGTGFPAERTLYHGTAPAAVSSINRNGFNRSYCGKNATRFGEGVYFAVDASYSAARTYSPPDKDGERRIYMCKVLTGEYTVGKSSYKTPPPKNPAHPNVLFNTVVDDDKDPRMFVTFHDASAYPEYLITFT